MKKKQKNIIILLFIIIISLAITYYFVPKEVKFEDVTFKGILENYTLEFIPYEIYFSIINPNFRPVNCIAILSLTKDGEKNETSHDIGEIPQRTKLKYKIPFNMPIGNTGITLIKKCTI
jgi:hypothetical protein